MRAFRLFLLVAVCLPCLSLGCSKTEVYNVGQPIAMGPFVFEVVTASAKNFNTGRRKIKVHLKLLDDKSNGKTNFGYFLSDQGDGQGNLRIQMKAHPHISIEDDHGHSFVTDVRGGSGSWAATFELDVSLRGPSQKLATKEALIRLEHLIMEPKDFRLTITNPDPRKGQPGAVSIQLQ